jgi:hypothetical protein
MDPRSILLDMTWKAYDPKAWEVEYTDEFYEWWEGLTVDEQESVGPIVGLLEEWGPYLGHPHSSKVRGSRYGHMRELRVQHAGRPLRVLYAFDPRRSVILLLGGARTGDKRWYRRHVPLPDKLYEEHLLTLQEEGLIDGEEVP